MLGEFTSWLLDLVGQLFEDFWSFFGDLFIDVADKALTALATIVNGIPVPNFLAQGLNAFYGGLPGDILWILGQCGVPAALALYGSGYAFRLARKVVTLFQW